MDLLLYLPEFLELLKDVVYFACPDYEASAEYRRFLQPGYTQFKM